MEPGGTLCLLLRLRTDGGSLRFVRELRGLITVSDVLISFYLGSLVAGCYLGVVCNSLATGETRSFDWCWGDCDPTAIGDSVILSFELCMSA